MSNVIPQNNSRPKRSVNALEPNGSVLNEKPTYVPKIDDMVRNSDTDYNVITDNDFPLSNENSSEYCVVLQKVVSETHHHM